MNCTKIKIYTLAFLFFVEILLGDNIFAQQTSTTHTRGKLWETLYNWGFIGDPGAWDYTETTGIGFYPGFAGFNYPHDEQAANGYITDANFHNFRTGPFIIVKDVNTPIPPSLSPQHKDFMIYEAALPTPVNPDGVLSSIPPFTRTENYNGSDNFNPLLPEETNTVTFNTSTGITVRQTSMAWSYPGYRDFIIYDYTFKNTGEVAIPSINQTVHYDQTLKEVWINFYSQLHVSTKGRLNFHYNSDFLSSAAPAGGFGWHPGSGYDNYYSVENENDPGKGLLFYSYHYNGGREPVPWDKYGIKSNWQQLLTKKPGWLPELQDPAAFGFVFLYRTPPKGDPNQDAFTAVPNYFSVYSDEADKFNGKTIDLETFGENTFSNQELYDLIKQNYRTANNGKDYCAYISAFGPYNLAPGDSVRLIVAEVAGELDLKQIEMGDPNHWFPDSTLAAIRRNADAARAAVKWGVGAPKINGINIAADVPEPPPAPNVIAANASVGTDSAIISIEWDKSAEQAKILDGSGKIFFDGSTDVSGYRIYRGSDKRGIWDLIADIPRSKFSKYFNSDINKYVYLDRNLQFGFEFYYYVQAYNSKPKGWTSANGTVVSNLSELKSGDYNRTPLTNAKPGPVSVEKGWDVFVAPNPYVEGDLKRSFGEPTPQKIEFRNLPEKCTIKIFNLSGDLVKTLEHKPDSFGNLSGSEAWDQRSDSGLLVAPGLYIYVVQSNTEGSAGAKFTGKLMIIR